MCRPRFRDDLKRPTNSLGGSRRYTAYCVVALARDDEVAPTVRLALDGDALDVGRTGRPLATRSTVTNGWPARSGRPPFRLESHGFLAYVQPAELSSSACAAFRPRREPGNVLTTRVVIRPSGVASSSCCS